MANLDNNHLRELARRFDLAETTVAEERTLMEALADPRRTLPPDLALLRDEAIWYCNMHRQQVAPTTHTPLAPRPWLRRLRIASAAAAVALIAVVAINFLGRQQHLDQEYATYAGSYVMRNGVKYTNLTQIMPELKRAEKMVQSAHRAAQREIEKAMPADVMPDDIDMDDPETRALLSRVMQ